MTIEVDRELFDVREIVQPNGDRSYQFTWTNGPANGTYGFVIGGSELASETLEGAARGFVHAFFEPGGIGASDFPLFCGIPKFVWDLIDGQTT